jgi:LemA protein
MKTSRILLVIAIALLIGAFLGGGCAYQGYRSAIQLDENVKNHWAQVENQLQRRYELIPNLVATVKGITEQEQKVFLGVAEARSGFEKAGTIAEKAEAASQVERALVQVRAVAEAYPDLRSSESFLKLQDQLEGTENRLSVERQRYNDSVRELNQFVRPFPGSLYAGFAGVKEGTYFNMTPAAETAPTVNFSDEKG